MLCRDLGRVLARGGGRRRAGAFQARRLPPACRTARRFESQAIRRLPPEDWKRHFLGAREGALVKLNDGGGVTVLGGHFQLAGPQAEMLLGMLPPIVHLQSETDRETLRWAFDRMRQELIDPKPGGFLIVQQLAYMIFVQALRLHLDEGTGVGWLFALSDKHVGAAIAAIHREPARRWTVATLALEVGMSRSGFAARFRQLVGDGPIEYLTRWRMLLAGRSLSRGEPIGAIARSLGYEFGKRVQHGLQARDGQHAPPSRAPGGRCLSLDHPDASLAPAIWEARSVVDDASRTLDVCLKNLFVAELRRE